MLSSSSSFYPLVRVYFGLRKFLLTHHFHLQRVNSDSTSLILCAILKVKDTASSLSSCTSPPLLRISRDDHHIAFMMLLPLFRASALNRETPSKYLFSLIFLIFNILTSPSPIETISVTLILIQ